MADIKQAARWLEEGKDIRRSVWQPDAFLSLEDSNFPVRYRRITQQLDDIYQRFCVENLLADDWEIAE